MSKKDIDKTFLRDVSGDIKIDLADPNNLSDKVVPEQETRKRFLAWAKSIGRERDMLLLFEKAEKTMRNCTNEKERKDMGKLFTVEVYKILGGKGKLYIDGQLVCDDEGN